MRWARVEYNGTDSYGIVEDDLVALVDGTPFDGAERNGTVLSLDDVKLLVPVIILLSFLRAIMVLRLMLI